MRDYEVIDLGVEHPDYFQGFGVAFTEFDNCAYGIGCDPEEALNDCLEMMGQAIGGSGAQHFYKVIVGGEDGKNIDIKDLILADFPDFADDTTWPDVPDGAFYHIGIRWKE